MTDHQDTSLLTDIILPAVPEDTAAVRKIMKECVNALPHREWFIDDQEDFIADHMGGEAGYTLKYMVDGQIAGYLIVHAPGLSEKNLARHLQFTDEQLMQVRHLESACVLPQYRGRHIQQKLMAEAIRLECGRAGVRYLLCTVHPENVYSRLNIEKEGLHEACRIVEYGWPRIVMMLDLKDRESGTENVC